jgi:hypothetical protein
MDPHLFGPERRQIGRNARSTPLLRFPSPKQPETLPVPTDQRVGFHDGEGTSPVEQTRQPSLGKADGVGRPARLRFPLNRKASCLQQKQIFGRECCCGPETQPYKGQRVQEDAKDGPNGVQQRWDARFY